jgi:CheY-like chemotaxis protein
MTERRKKILLVDDDEAVLDVLQAKLGATFDIVSTNDAQKAVGLAIRERPDLIVCDIDMPDMDGRRSRSAPQPASSPRASRRSSTTKLKGAGPRSW